MIGCLDSLAKERIIHRDLKPSNFMIECEHPIEEPLLHTSEFKIILVDFGLAKPMDTSFSHNGNEVYKPPELLEGIKNSSKSD